MRRAVVLETKLGRPAESRALLEDTVREHEDWAVLRMLADSWERSEDHERAAELWLRARELSPDPEEASNASFRAASALFALGKVQEAAEVLRQVRHFDYATRELQLSLARASEDREAELEAMMGLAEKATEPPQRADHHLAAARLAFTLGKFDIAERQAKRASEVQGAPAEARLLAAQLHVRNHPIATRRHAHDLLQRLSGTEEVEGAQNREMRVFLLAEARSVLDGHAAAIALLEAALKEQGPRALLSASLAEKVEDPERALLLYEQAIGAELRGMRREGDLLLHAAEVAKRQGQFDRARAFASAVADDDPRRPDAARQLEAIAVEETRQRRMEREARARAEEELTKRREREAKEIAEKEARERAVREEAEREDRKEREAEEARQREAEREEREAEEARQREAEREEREAEEARQREAEREEREAKEARQREAEREEREQRATDAAAAKEASQRAAREEAEHERRLAKATEERVESPSSRPPPRGPTTEPPLPLGELLEVDHLSPEEERHALHIEPEDEEQLVLALERGDVDAGVRLFQSLSKHRSRTRDASVVAGHLARLRLGNASFLGRLVTAAARDGNEPLALAVRHVLGSYGAGDEVAAPPLTRIQEQPEAIQAVLWNGVRVPSLEVTRLIWEHAQALFKKEPSDYDINGVQRVPLTSPTALAALYREAARLLGMTRAALFRKPGGVGIEMRVALLVPPAVIVHGDVGDVSAEFAYHLGAMLAAAAPEHALVFGSRPEDLEQLVQAVALSFGQGRTQSASRPAPEVGRLAARLWETIPPRVQRRLSASCAEAEEDFSAEALWGAGRWVLRRAGLLVCGNIRTAIDDACSEVDVAPPENLSELEQIAARYPAVADLLALAISPTYAEIRFRAQHTSVSAIRTDSQGV